MKQEFFLHQFIIILLIPVLFLSSCKKENRWDLVKRTGKRISETRELPAFDKIRAKDEINVYIRQGSPQQVRVEAGKNLVPLIKTEVKEGMLTIWDDNKCKWARSYQNGVINVYITIPEIISILQYGWGKIISEDTLHCETLNIRTNETGDVDLTVNAKIVYNQLFGNCDVTLRGKSTMMGIYHTGEGYFYASSLVTEFVWSHCESSGDEHLTVNKALSGKVLWKGNIYYAGSPPEVNLEVNGNGKAIPVN